MKGNEGRCGSFSHPGPAALGTGGKGSMKLYGTQKRTAKTTKMEFSGTGIDRCDARLIGSAGT
ncbi:hypothetical protein EJB05_12020, partial [Eragrostis curvula]